MLSGSGDFAPLELKAGPLKIIDDDYNEVLSFDDKIEVSGSQGQKFSLSVSEFILIAPKVEHSIRQAIGQNFNCLKMNSLIPNPTQIAKLIVKNAPVESLEEAFALGIVKGSCIFRVSGFIDEMKIETQFNAEFAIPRDLRLIIFFKRKGYKFVRSSTIRGKLFVVSRDEVDNAYNSFRSKCKGILGYRTAWNEIIRQTFLNY